jgi:hypothetical protein
LQKAKLTITTSAVDVRIVGMAGYVDRDANGRTSSRATTRPKHYRRRC